MPKKPTKKPGATIPADLKGLLPPPHFGPLNRPPPSEAELDAQRLRILIERLEQLAKHYGIQGTLLNKCFWLCALSLRKNLACSMDRGREEESALFGQTMSRWSL